MTNSSCMISAAPPRTSKSSTVPVTKGGAKKHHGVAMTFWISEGDRGRLRQLSETADVSVSNLINRSIRRLLDDPSAFFTLKSHTDHTLQAKRTRASIGT
jgi:hypothetical protein